MKIVMWVVGVLVLAGCGPTEQSPKDRQRDVIAYCWGEQAKKSLAPAEARFIAGACEKLERDFVTAYGVKP